MSIKAAQRAALDVRHFSIEGIAREIGDIRGEVLDPATLRRYLSDTYKGCTPVDLIHPWYIATGGDLSPVLQQVHLCGMDLRPMWESLDPGPDSHLQVADFSRDAGELVALLIRQWSDGRRTAEERRASRPLMIHIRAHLDQLIAADEAVTGGK